MTVTHLPRRLVLALAGALLAVAVAAPSADARYFRARCKSFAGSATLGIYTTKRRVPDQNVKRSLITTIHYQIKTKKRPVEMYAFQRAVFSVAFPDNGQAHPWAGYKTLKGDGRVHTLNMKSGGYDVWPAGKWHHQTDQDVYYGYDFLFAFDTLGNGCTLKFYPYDGTV